MKKYHNSLDRVFFLLLLAAFVISLFLKLSSVLNNNIVITYDQGRDLIDIRQMAEILSPRLVGPTTSINGVLLGPFWYYFNLLPYMISGGNPVAIAVWQIIWYQISAILLYFALKRINNILSSTATILYLLLPTGFYTARYFWNANSMPFFTTIFFVALIWVFLYRNTTKGKSNSAIPITPSRRAVVFPPPATNVIARRVFSTWQSHSTKLFILGLVAGLALQIEAAFGILLFPFAFLYLFLFPPSSSLRISAEAELKQSPILRNIKTVFVNSLWLTSGFFITLLPQIVFEFRHEFQMTKLLIATLSGHSDTLGQKMAFADRLDQRILYFFNSLRDTSHIPEKFLFPLYAILLICFLFFLKKKRIEKKTQHLFWILASFTLFSAIFYLLFPQALKVWYTLSLSVPLVLIFAILLHSLRSAALPKYLSVFFVIMVLLFAFYETHKAQTEYIVNTAFSESGNASLLRNQLTVIDQVYKKADGRGFNVYSYNPSIYDYAYQYLFWWHGTKTYGYQPADIAYLPGQPEYIEDHSFFWKKTRPAENDLTFLIIEKRDNNDLFQKWIGNFSGLCQQEKISYPFNTEIRTLEQCTE